MSVKDPKRQTSPDHFKMNIIRHRRKSNVIWWAKTLDQLNLDIGKDHMKRLKDK